MILLWLRSAAETHLTCPSRHIDKVGGLDNYILTVPKRKQQSDIAEQLRQRIEGALQKPLQDALQANTEAGCSSFAPSVQHKCLSMSMKQRNCCLSGTRHLADYSQASFLGHTHQDYPRCLVAYSRSFLAPCNLYLRDVMQDITKEVSTPVWAV